jgi:hypothetical protein
MHFDFILIFNLSISIFGIFIVLLLAFNPPTIHENLFWRKPLIGLVFIIICMLGVFAALFPKPCSQIFYSKRENVNFHSRQIDATSHHPNCEEFSAHVIHVNGHTLCAACTGLLLGALITVTGTVFYFFGGWHAEEISLPLVLIGVIGVASGFIQLKFRSFVRLMLNALFVLGAFLILVGIEELTKSLFVEIFLVALIVFWILTRIQVSQWDHWRICRSCKFPCEVWEKGRK